MKNTNKGITLIALVITIIVMLILVAVTITMAVNGGLFEYAQRAGTQTNEAKANEQLLASGQVNIDNVVYNSIDEYISSGNTTIDWDAILASANANPNSYKHEDQDKSDHIGIGTDGNPVNMDLWNPKPLSDGTWLLGDETGSYEVNDSYAGSCDGGEIEGKIPQYIYNTETKTFKPVTAMRGTFREELSLIRAPEIPQTVVETKGLFFGCTSLESTDMVGPNGFGGQSNYYRLLLS